MIANTTNHQRGFALTTAIALMSLIATMLLVIGMTLSADARRTIDGACDAQLRQLLLIGGQRAAEVDAAGPMHISLPAELVSRGGALSLTLSAESPDSRIVTVDARIDGRVMRQEISLALRDNRWQATGVVLSPGHPAPNPATHPATQPTR